MAATTSGGASRGRQAQDSLDPQMTTNSKGHAMPHLREQAHKQKHEQPSCRAK